MTDAELETKLRELMSLPAETEWVEFKEAKNSFEFEKLGKYFSALSNEANLKARDCAWFVFGVSDKPPRQIVGTNYKRDRAALDSLKKGVADQTNNNLTFEEIHELTLQEGRVLMFQIPPASRGVPTTWKGHYYGRHGESLAALNPHEYEQIRAQGAKHDWSAQVCAGASLADLDPKAIEFARTQYREKHPHQSDHLDQWDDITFLKKAKVCVADQITNAALVLLGKAESEHWLSPAVAQITWVLKDEQKLEKDYQHFGPPLILAVDQVLAKIRNLTIRHMPSGTLFPREIQQYDSWVMRETLHNCIAHQDYTLAARINVVEEPASLLFTNLGRFIPGSVEEVIRRDAPPEQYRNPLLAQAMVNLNMIDTIGSGIKRMFSLQRNRFFPMPDYDLEEAPRVKVRLFGGVLDENYTRMLIDKTDLDLWEVIALDKVQKGYRIDDAEFRLLKAQKLIEGRRPNLFVSAKIAAATEDRATYIKHRAFDKDHYKKMIVSYLEQFGEAKRADINRLLLDKLSDALTQKQKTDLVRNLLQEMRREGSIKPIGARKSTRWVLSKSAPEDND